MADHFTGAWSVWEHVLPSHIIFEGRRFDRTGGSRPANRHEVEFYYSCPDFFQRTQMPGLYVILTVHPYEDPFNGDVVAAKLEYAKMSLTESARREHERTPLLDLDTLVNGDQE